MVYTLDSSEGAYWPDAVDVVWAGVPGGSPWSAEGCLRGWPGYMALELFVRCGVLGVWRQEFEFRASVVDLFTFVRAAAGLLTTEVRSRVRI